MILLPARRPLLPPKSTNSTWSSRPTTQDQRRLRPGRHDSHRRAPHAPGVPQLRRRQWPFLSAPSASCRRDRHPGIHRPRQQPVGPAHERHPHRHTVDCRQPLTLRPRRRTRHPQPHVQQRTQTCTPQGGASGSRRQSDVLNIGKLAAGPSTGRYYDEQVAQGRGGLLNAEHPESGEPVRTPMAEGAVAGFDLTFRAPKSVSVIFGIGEDPVAGQVRAAHEAPVAGALGYLEREACRARRGKGGAIQVVGGGFVGAAFEHRTSRAGDPLLHTHVVIANETQGPDARWTALDGPRSTPTARPPATSTRRRCAPTSERLGVTWQPVERGTADLTASRAIRRALLPAPCRDPRRDGPAR